MSTMTAKVTANGQVSLPAAVRRRWGTREVVIVDRGDELLVYPVRPLGALRGRYAGRGVDSTRMRAQERAGEADAEARGR